MKKPNWFQRLVAGSIIRQLQDFLKSETSYRTNAELKLYDRDARIKTLEGDVSTLSSERVEFEAKCNRMNEEYTHIQNSYQLLKHAHTKAQERIKELEKNNEQQATSLGALTEAIGKTAQDLVKAKPRTRKKTTDK